MLEKKLPTRFGAVVDRAARRVPETWSATPGRLARVGVVLVLGCLLVAMVSMVGGITRTHALTDAREQAAALIYDAATIYSSLATADADATSGYVSGGLDPADLRRNYDAKLAQASGALADAAKRLPTDMDDDGSRQVDTIATALPTYASKIEAARTYNRDGLPLGRTYLDQASTLMRQTILPAAAGLRTIGATALAVDSDDGGGPPFAVALLGVAVLAGVVDLSLREARRTRRRFSPGLVAAAGLLLVGLLWWAVVGVVSTAAVSRASDKAAATGALEDSRAAALRARSAEGLALVARNGAGDQDVAARLVDILGPPAAPEQGMVASAAAHGADVTGIRSAAQAWSTAHDAVRRANDLGLYTDAAASVTGVTPNGSGAGFVRLDQLLANAVDRERDAFTAALDAARRVQVGLPVVPTVLFVLAGVAAGLAVVERLREYR